MQNSQARSLVMGARENIWRSLTQAVGRTLLFSMASVAALAVLFIFYFIAKDAFPFFRLEGFKEFFLSDKWYPSQEPASFGALPIIVGSVMVTIGAVVIAVPLGVSAAVCLSDVLPFKTRQLVKPVIEILAAIPSVAYGFFALVVFAPQLQNNGSTILMTVWYLLASPVLLLATLVLGDLATARVKTSTRHRVARLIATTSLGLLAALLLFKTGQTLSAITVVSGTNALNVSIILGFMALPTIVSVSEDALQAAGRQLREGSYALGATRAETMCRVILPAASSGILAAILLGVMRALGETMVVWMASGNAAQIPSPFYNYLAPVRTLTATIAGDMGEADHVTGSSRYHVLFAMAFCLLAFSFTCNLASEWVVSRQRRKLGGE